MRDDQRVGVEVRVALSTLLGHDDRPGEIAGLGPIPATHARAVVAEQRRAEWRWAITDANGRLLFDGITRRRPTGLAATGPRGGIVELHLPAALLSELTSVAPATEPAVARWAGVLADIARRYGERDRRDLDAHPDDRLPRAALRRHTQIRDRSCVGIGCRRRPTRCDQDHTVEYRHGGETVAASRRTRICRPRRAAALLSEMRDQRRDRHSAQCARRWTRAAFEQPTGTGLRAMRQPARGAVYPAANGAPPSTADVVPMGRTAWLRSVTRLRFPARMPFWAAAATPT